MLPRSPLGTPVDTLLNPLSGAAAETPYIGANGTGTGRHRPEPDNALTDVVPHGFSPQELWPLPARLARHRLDLPQQQLLLLQLGRIVPGKGIDVAIRSLVLLRSRHGVDASLLVVGGGPPDAPELPELVRLRALANTLGVGAQVRFWGRTSRAQLRYFYGAADVFISMPSYEAFGITAVEAMACARPVVAADSERLRSIILDGETGLLIPPGDPELLCMHLHALAAYPALAACMGEHGMRRAHRYYTWRALAQRMAASHVKAQAQAETKAGAAEEYGTLNAMQGSRQP